MAAVVLVAMVAAGARVPLATEGDGGWDLFIPNMTPPTLPVEQLTERRSIRESTQTPGVGAFALLAQVVIIMLVAALVAVSGGRWRATGGASNASRCHRSPTSCP